MTSKASSDARARARSLAKSSIHGVHSWTAESLAKAVLAGQREALAQAITWVESTLPEHQPRNEELLRLTHHPDRRTQRLGITGIPGAGKSTLIERLGMDAIRNGHRVAVLAVDPSSTRTKGSLLGDKTRMRSLSMHPDAFVSPLPRQGRWVGSPGPLRPSALRGGWVQSDFGGNCRRRAKRSHVRDMNIITLIGGAGDDVQGIKRGVVEMCDIPSTSATATGSNQASSPPPRTPKLALLPMPSPTPLLKWFWRPA